MVILAYKFRFNWISCYEKVFTATTITSPTVSFPEKALSIKKTTQNEFKRGILA